MNRLARLGKGLAGVGFAAWRRPLIEHAVATETGILQEVLHSVPQAIAVLDGDRTVRFGNRSLAALVARSFPAPAIVGMALDQVLAAIGLADEDISTIRSAALPFETRATTTDNVPLRLRLSPTESGHVLLSVSDLTHQHREEAERLAQQERMLHAEKNQAVVALAASMAHDFNNVLGVILGFSSLAGTRLRKLSRALAECDPAAASELLTTASTIDNVVESADQGRQIVASLAVLTRREEADVKLVDVRHVLAKSEHPLRMLLPASVRLIVEPCGQPCLVRVNPVHIEQIVTNLCINSMHALEGHTGRISLGVEALDLAADMVTPWLATARSRRGADVRVEVLDAGVVAVSVGALTPRRYVCLSIADDGAGISEEVAHNLFTPFFTTKGPDKGTGLGLNSVLGIVETYGGGIDVRSCIGAGTRFRILLPEAAIDPQVAETVQPEPAAAASSDVGGGTDEPVRVNTRILVVDDEPKLVALAREVLRMAGYDVEDFTDPVAALQRLSMAPDEFDLLITDETMPLMTGTELVARVRGIRDDLPIIICTGYAKNVLRDGSLPAGVRSILEKPYRPPELATTVRKVLAAA